MDHRKARFYGVWSQVIAFGGIILAIVYLNTPWLYIFGTLGILAGLASVVILGLFWRCPHCRKRLPVDNRIFDIANCPLCGQDLGLAPPEEIQENTDNNPKEL